MINTHKQGHKQHHPRIHLTAQSRTVPLVFKLLRADNLKARPAGEDSIIGDSQARQLCFSLEIACYVRSVFYIYCKSFRIVLLLERVVFKRSRLSQVLSIFLSWVGFCLEVIVSCRNFNVDYVAYIIIRISVYYFIVYDSIVTYIFTLFSYFDTFSDSRFF